MCVPVIKLISVLLQLWLCSSVSSTISSKTTIPTTTVKRKASRCPAKVLQSTITEACWAARWDLHHWPTLSLWSVLPGSWFSRTVGLLWKYSHGTNYSAIVAFFGAACVTYCGRQMFICRQRKINIDPLTKVCFMILWMNTWQPKDRWKSEWRWDGMRRY